MPNRKTLPAFSPFQVPSAGYASAYIYATTGPVGGGTSEIQRNISASRGRGMPRA